MTNALQHEVATFCPRIQAAGDGKHRPCGEQKDDALTCKLDQSVGAGHFRYLSTSPAVTVPSALP